VTYRLYSYWRSSSAWRVRIGLALKGLPYEYVAVNLVAGEQFQDAHRARHPMGMVPVLEVVEGGHVVHLTQSMAILEYLDERHPTPPLLPRELDGRAVVRALAEHVNSGIQPLQNSAPLKVLREKEPGSEKAWARHFIATGLAALEQAMTATAGRHAMGDVPGLADCYLVPQVYNARRWEVDLAPFPTLRRVDEACAALPAFQAAHPDRQPDAPPPDRRTP
jgi:maleylpyruvate isomerase